MLLLPMLALGGPAQGSHDADVHSQNMLLVATVDTGRGGEMAFWRDTAVLAHGAGDADLRNDGFVLLDISDPMNPVRISEFTCVASAWDIAIWGDLVILGSWKEATTGPACDASVPAFPGPDGFTGIRLVSIKDPAHPIQVGAVATKVGLGAHTFTLLPDLDHLDEAGRKDPRLLAYMSSSTAEPLELVEVPLREPAAARLVTEFAAPASSACHDFSLFLPRNLAICSNAATTIYDISDPLRLVHLATIANPTAHHHGSVVSWDGKTLVIGDEPLPELFVEGFTDAEPEVRDCYAGTDVPRGVYWFYDITNARNPVLTDTFQLPREVHGGYCSSHQMNVVPFSDGRNVLVAAWYLGGTTVVDFTDPRDVNEIAYYAASPADPQRRSNPFSSYWYNGYVYANNLHASLVGAIATTDRGLDVFKIQDAGLKHDVRLPYFNFGTQECLSSHGAGKTKAPCAAGSG
ncbi:MAG TPA: hypothetical protein VI818_05985 [Candidatus Thermoplasmatota archaeon]|nr:hypothetical protein [Candidatus Thermoplasmatota archaeon]